eukprot:6194260-Pleurochrysis_carterae.AAC.1
MVKQPVVTPLPGFRDHSSPNYPWDNVIHTDDICAADRFRRSTARLACAVPSSATMAASEDESSLVELMRSGTAEAVQQALATYGDINTRAPNSESPIVACAEAGRESLLEMLLTSNADPNASSASGLTALCAAAMHGHLGCVKALLQAGANADEKRGRMQTSALSYAAQEGHRSVCEVLLEAGADPHGRDAFGQSPIDYAERRAEEGRMKAVEFEQVPSSEHACPATAAIEMCAQSIETDRRAVAYSTLNNSPPSLASVISEGVAFAAQWASRVAERAAVIEAEPPPAPSPFPLHLKEDLHRIVKVRDASMGVGNKMAKLRLSEQLHGPVSDGLCRPAKIRCHAKPVPPCKACAALSTFYQHADSVNFAARSLIK